MAHSRYNPTTTIAKVKTTAQRGSRWLKNRFNGRQGSQASTQTRSLSIGPPTNFRREELTVGTDVEGKTLLVQQAREDAQNMHKGSKMEKVKRHARKISAKFGPAGEGKHVESDIH